VLGRGRAVPAPLPGAWLRVPLRQSRGSAPLPGQDAPAPAVPLLRAGRPCTSASARRPQLGGCGSDCCSSLLASSAAAGPVPGKHRPSAAASSEPLRGGCCSPESVHKSRAPMWFRFDPLMFTSLLWPTSPDRSLGARGRPVARSPLSRSRGAGGLAAFLRLSALHGDPRNTGRTALAGPLVGCPQPLLPPPAPSLQKIEAAAPGRVGGWCWRGHRAAESWGAPARRGCSLPLGTNCLCRVSQSVKPRAQARAAESPPPAGSLGRPPGHPLPLSSPAPACFLIYGQNHTVTEDCNQDTL